MNQKLVLQQRRHNKRLATIEEETGRAVAKMIDRYVAVGSISTDLWYAHEGLLRRVLRENRGFESELKHIAITSDIGLVEGEQPPKKPSEEVEEFLAGSISFMQLPAVARGVIKEHIRELKSRPQRSQKQIEEEIRQLREKSGNFQNYVKPMLSLCHELDRVKLIATLFPEPLPSTEAQIENSET